MPKKLRPEEDPLSPFNDDGERLADARLKEIFEGPLLHGLGVAFQRGHLVQGVLDAVINGKP